MHPPRPVRAALGLARNAAFDPAQNRGGIIEARARRLSTRPQWEAPSTSARPPGARGRGSAHGPRAVVRGADDQQRAGQRLDHHPGLTIIARAADSGPSAPSATARSGRSRSGIAGWWAGSRLVMPYSSGPNTPRRRGRSGSTASAGVLGRAPHRRRAAARRDHQRHQPPHAPADHHGPAGGDRGGGCPRRRRSRASRYRRGPPGRCGRGPGDPRRMRPSHVRRASPASKSTRGRSCWPRAPRAAAGASRVCGAGWR